MAFPGRISSQRIEYNCFWYSHWLKFRAIDDLHSKAANLTRVTREGDRNEWSINLICKNSHSHWLTSIFRLLAKGWFLWQWFIRKNISCHRWKLIQSSKKLNFHICVTRRNPINADTKVTCTNALVIWVSVSSGLGRNKCHGHMFYWFKD